MTKWFDTNYHYLVPELGPERRVPPGGRAQAPGRAGRGPRARHRHPPGPARPGHLPAARQGRPTAPPAGFDRLSLLDPLLEVYAELLDELAAAGAEWVQLDEPAFVQDRSPRRAGRPRPRLRPPRPVPARPKLLVSSYFDHLGDALGVLAGAPVDGHRPRPDPGRRPQPRAAGRRRRHRRPDPGRRGGRRPQRLGQRPGAVAVHPGHPARPGRRRGRVDLLLAPARPDRPGRRAGPRPGGPAAGWPSPARRSPRWSPWPAGWPRAPTPSPTSWRRTARDAGRPPPVGPDPRPGRAPARWTRSASPTCTGPARTTSARRPSGAGSACRRCRRPPSARSPRPARSARPGRPAAGASWTRPATPERMRGRDRRGHPAPGRAGAGRARPRGARAQRHGPVLRRAARRGGRHRARLGPVLRHPLCPPADHLRRRLPAGRR